MRPRAVTAPLSQLPVAGGVGGRQTGREPEVFSDARARRQNLPIEKQAALFLCLAYESYTLGKRCVLGVILTAEV